MREPVTIGEALKSAISHFKANHIDTPELDARLLLEALMNYSHAHIISNADEMVSPEIVEQYFDQVSDRVAGKPVHRILGKREFYGREFGLNEETLIPRPDTEILIEETLAKLKSRSGPQRLLEIGTGSGAIAVTLACELEDLEILATDISAVALEQASHNAVFHNVKDRISFQEADLFASIDIEYDAIISNPPYIPSSDLSGLQEEVREHDPHRALDGGIDGLDFYREIFANAQSFLKSGGFVAVEIGIGQSDAILDLATRNQFTEISKKRDLSGIYRVVSAHKA